MTRDRAIEVARELIPKIYVQPSAKEVEFTKSIREGILVNPDVLEKMHKYFDTQPSFEEIWADTFLKDWITE